MLRNSIRIRNLSTLTKFRWKDCHLPIQNARVPPTSWYTEPAFLQQVELRHSFRGKNWLFFARTEQLAKSHSFVAKHVAGGTEPVVVINISKEDSSDGQPKLAGYYNVCRHHAAQLLDEGEGVCSDERRITCPYHGWQYHIQDGRLAKAIQIKGSEIFKSKENGLVPVLVDVVGPWVFVNLGGSPTGTLLGDQPDLQGMIDQLEHSNYQSLRFVRSKSYRIKCNWKVYMDNYLDGGYHVPTAHPGLAAELDMESYQRIPSDSYFLQSCNNIHSKHGPADGSNVASRAARTSGHDTTAGTELGQSSPSTPPHDTAAPAASAAPALYYFHFPSLCINRYGKWMDINVVEPDGPDACNVHFEWYCEEDVLSQPNSAAVVDQCLTESEQIQVEDVWLCERVQRGLRSSAYSERVGIYAPKFELGEYMFHQRLAEDLEVAIATECDSDLSV
jgi:choline monooxygenase